ncbi:RCC1/BLIP-II protein [Rhizoclosmatium globosum]|uniref:RCC1/BLIP-II protein n=1 Tax=Rhizoclosmatium globosum TaxID=329046 RepID=A0A1Y2CBQ7_9FUNG|nr:RCC1/BLIP-II protein [Rhizoclosmatium globosum]|eukprot:ORY44469.1 RCC1/BLIP-II protein [Rhizoclosmatium globosum]
MRNTTLLSAIRSHDASLVTKLLESANSNEAKKSLLNEKDASGTPCLLLIQDTAVMDAFLTNSSKDVDVNALDESGGTVLHRTLYDGSLQLALNVLQRRPDADLTVRDKDGNTCLDLLDLSINQTSAITDGSKKPRDDEDSDEDDDDSTAKKQKPHQIRYTSSVWTWGSNSNLQLGHATNSNDRQYPERVELTPHLHLKPPVSYDTLSEHKPNILMMSLSKYHSTILTDTHLYTFGFGVGGRLGLNHEETTLSPSVVHALSDYFVSFVATGPDHTVAVTGSGEVFTWGSNKWGQLGYETFGSNIEAASVLVPTEVTHSSLKKVKIVGAAATKYHTVVFSNNGLIFTWGWNIGQLGYQQQQQHQGSTGSNLTAVSPLQSTPRKITSLVQSDNILQVAATNNATAILYEKGDVYVICNHETKRISLTVPPPPLLQSSKSSLTASIIKIVSGNHQFAALSKEGDVFLWSPPVGAEGEAYKNSWQQVTFPQSKPKRIWTARKLAMAAKDVAIGIDSCILVVTESGHVYSGTRRKEVKTKEAKGYKDVVYFKFAQVPYLRNIRFIYASPSGAFAAIRYDELPPPTVLAPITLRDDLKKIMIPFSEPDDSSLARTALPGSPFVDVRLVIRHNGQEYLFSAHQIILSARSQLFLRVFDEVGKKGAIETEYYQASVEFEGTSDAPALIRVSFLKEFSPKRSFQR